MRLALDPRTRLLLRTIPHTTVYSAIELALLTLLALQCARLFWVAMTPVSPIGEWRAAGTDQSAGPAELLGAFDPFFRIDGAAALAATTLDVKLHGIRENRATGGGAAIIALPDGQQHSFAVRDEIMPGVVLVGVTFGSVTISRNGIVEQLFLEEFGSAPDSSPVVVTTTVPTINFAPNSAPSPMAAPAAAAPPVQYQPRMNGTQVTGIIVQPTGDGAAFGASGLEPGDVIVSVNGQRITSAQQAQSLGTQLGSGNANIEVEREGRTVPLRLRIGQ